MRKISLIIAALALVLGLSQCKKENKPAASGETQRIVLTASNGNDGSKVDVAVNEATKMLDLTWENTDVIMASGAVEGPLRYVSGEGCIAQFEGTVTRKEGDNVTFTVGAAPASFEDQTGDVAWIKSHMHLVGTDVYKEEGSYTDVNMQLQYAVLKLDLSALGTASGNVVTIKADGTTVATVTGVTTANKVYYVAMLAPAETTYTFSGNGMNVTKTWTLANNIFYTGDADGAAIVITPDYLCFTAEQAGSTVKMKKIGSLTLPELVYRTDGNDWSTFTPGTTEITLTSVGDKVYFRSTAEASTFSSSDNKYACFVMSGKIAASGNVMSLISPDCSATKIPCDYCFNSLFSDCASLTAAPELPATELKEYCYRRMFSGCKSLTQAPAKLPAATLADLCYISMFSGCTSLKAAPELPAENLVDGCYDSMFSRCTSLKAAPELPAQTLCLNCYKFMFSECENLSSITMLATNGFDEANCLEDWLDNAGSSSEEPILWTNYDSEHVPQFLKNKVPDRWMIKKIGSK